MSTLSRIFSLGPKSALTRTLVAALILSTQLSCQGQSSRDRVKDATQRIKPKLVQDLSKTGLRFGDPVFIRIFKQERKLELWLQEPDKEHFKLFRTYPIAGMSGTLGPKLKEGDRQAPEGFYFVTKDQLNPQSRYHLSFNIGYPNTYDRAHGRTGSFIMVHGNKLSIGCFAMTDPKIEEIYLLCEAALNNGQPFFRVHSFPFQMTERKMTPTKGHKWEPFWQNLKQGYHAFETTKTPPNVEVSEKRYIFTKP